MLRSEPNPVDELLATAAGRVHRDDPVLEATGGPAGNARLTAWLGLALLVVFVAECVTLLSLTQLISWHIVLGAVLVPMVLAKTAVTGWRIVRYYTGDASYRTAGPPPLLLRILGPFAVLTGLAVLGTGLALIALPRSSTYTAIATVAGRRLDPLMLHKVTFVLWLVVVGAHTLARTIPALRLAAGRTTAGAVPGGAIRATILVATLSIGLVGGLAVLHYSGSWTHGDVGRHHHELDGGDR